MRVGFQCPARQSNVPAGLVVPLLVLPLLHIRLALLPHAMPICPSKQWTPQLGTVGTVRNGLQIMS
jgi:hypothetical protein